jgi:hypothetical protein
MLSHHKQPILKDNIFRIPVKPALNPMHSCQLFLSICLLQIIDNPMVTLDNSNAMGYD